MPWKKLFACQKLPSQYSVRQPAKQPQYPSGHPCPLSTLICYLTDVASLFCKYGHPCATKDAELGPLSRELNQHLDQGVPSRAEFLPFAGIFDRLQTILTAGPIKNGGTAHFQTRAADVEHTLVVHESTRRIKMLSSADHNRHAYPFAGVYSDDQVGALDLDTPVGLRSTPLKTFMNGKLLEVLLRYRSVFTMEQSLFPTMGDLLPVPWEGAVQPYSAWR